MALPLPKVVADVGPGGPLVTSMRGINALANDELQNKKLGVETEYAPWTNYANALSKIAYSQFVGPQAIATMMNNPATRGMFTPEQYNQLANAFTRQLQNNSTSTANIPVPGQQSKNILSRIFDHFDNNKNNETRSPSNALQDLNQPSINIANSSPQNANELNKIPQLPQQNQLIQPNSIQPGGAPTYNRAVGNLPGGVYGANNPSAITSAGEAALKTQTTEEAKNISDQWQKRQDDINEQVNGAQEMSRQLDKLVDARQRLSKYEKGPGLGSLPGVTSAAQDADIAISNLVAARLKAWQSSRITNMDIGFGQMLKPGRYMTDPSFNNEVNYEKGLSERLQEYPPFSQVAQSSGLTPAQADAVWARYANEKPFYDPKSKKILPVNLGQWETYLTPESLQETFSPSFKKKMDIYRKNMAGGNSKEDSKILNASNENSNFTKVMTPDGKLWKIPKNKLNEAIKRGAKEVE